jgi:hypothetical protein
MAALSAIGQIAPRVTDADRADTSYPDTLGLIKLYRIAP